MNICRICLSSGPAKDIFDRRVTKSCNNANYVKIIKFCLGLDIQVTKLTSNTTKLCIKCVRKLVTFYKFKSLAIKNDTYFQTLHKNAVKLEDNVSDDTQHSENEGSVYCDNISVKTEPIDELDIKYEEVEYLETDNDLSAEIILTTNEGLTVSEKKESRPKLYTKEKTKKSNTKTICEVCGKAVKCIQKHKCLKKSTDENVSCEECKKVFANPTSLKRHVNAIHLGIKSICKICNKAVSILSHHTKVMHNREALQHVCSICDRRYYSAALLVAHMNSHTQTRPFQCDYCSKGFTKKPQLVTHIRSIHLKEKPFLCQVCSKGFFKKYSLQEHLRKHSDQKSYKCEVCNKQFKSRTNLQSHLQLHAAEKKFACKHCDMTFYKQAYLKSHMITHIKEKRFTCSYCDAKFVRGDYRKHHEFTAHQKHFLTSNSRGKVK